MLPTLFSSADLPALANGMPTPVVLTEKLLALARAWGLPVETLASYVLEDWAKRHEAGQPLLLLFDHRNDEEFTFEEET